MSWSPDANISAHSLIRLQCSVFHATLAKVICIQMKQSEKTVSVFSLLFFFLMWVCHPLFLRQSLPQQLEWLCLVTLWAFFKAARKILLKYVLDSERARLRLIGVFALKDVTDVLCSALCCFSHFFSILFVFPLLPVRVCVRACASVCVFSLVRCFGTKRETRLPHSLFGFL